jgi:hypothetical protein
MGEPRTKDAPLRSASRKRPTGRADGSYGKANEASPRTRLLLVALAVVAVVATAGVGSAIALHAIGGPAALAPNRLEISAADSTAAVGESIAVRVIQTTQIPTSGTQATLNFDRAKLQIKSVSWGEAFQSAAVLVPSEWSQAIESANASGSLKKVAAAFTPPNQVPAGTRDLLTITFSAVGCGQSKLELPIGPTDATMLDGETTGYGDTITVGTVGGTVEVSC